MPGQTWGVQLLGGIHTVEIRHVIFSPKEYLYVDDVLVGRASKWFALSSVHEFELEGHPAAAYIKSNGTTFNYDLAIDSISVETGVSVIEPQRLPIWAWLFVVLSFFGPLAAFAISGATLHRNLIKWIAVTAIGVCLAMILDRTKTPAERVKRSAIVALLAWVLPLVFFIASRFMVF